MYMNNNIVFYSQYECTVKGDYGQSPQSSTKPTPISRLVTLGQSQPGTDHSMADLYYHELHVRGRLAYRKPFYRSV